MSRAPEGVRLASVADETALYRLCETMHAECSFASMSPRKVKDGIQKATRGQGGACGVIDGDGELAGGVCLTLAQAAWYSEDWVWTDLFLYIRPQYRSLKRANALLDWAKWWTDSVSPPDCTTPVPLSIGVLQPERVPAKLRLYRRHFPQVGGLFLYGQTRRGRMEVAHHGQQE